MKYDAINWDEGWSELVDPIVEAHENDKPYGRLEDKYDRRFITSASCKLYAERLLENLQKKYDQYEIAAHTDATAWPRNSYWRILIRKSQAKPIPERELTKIKQSAKAILRNVEKKYPGVGEKEQSKAKKAAKRDIRNLASAHGYKVRFAGEKEKKRGCLFALLALLTPIGTIAYFCIA